MKNNQNKLRSYLLKGIVLFVLSIASVSLTNNGILPFSQLYPTGDFLAVFLGGLVLVSLYEWLYRGYYREKLIGKFRIQTVIRFAGLCLIFTASCYPVFYILVNRSLSFDIFYLSVGLIQTILNSFIWMIVVYGIDIYYSFGEHKSDEKKAFKKVKGSVYLKPGNIAGAFIQNQIVYVLTMNGNRIPVEHTLIEVEDKLDTHNFFRVSRQYILQNRSVHSVDRAKNQKLKLHPIPQLNFPEEIIVSRHKAEQVKNWLKHSFS